MFEVTSRFMTRRIQEEVPLEVQLLIWYELDGQLNAGLKMDYLQIFKFEKIRKYARTRDSTSSI